MQDFINIAFKNFQEFYQSLDGRRKLSLFCIASALVVGMTVLVIWASKTQYKLLYSELSKEDIATISQLLDKGSIPYQVADEGKSIYVPEDMVDYWKSLINKLLEPQALSKKLISKELLKVSS